MTLDKDALDLLPCPMCGSGALLDGTESEIWAMCDCGAKGARFPSSSEAITAWNTRPTETRLTQERDTAVEAIRAVIEATGAYLPPDGIDAKECISRVLGATDNQKIIAALASIEGQAK